MAARCGALQEAHDGLAHRGGALDSTTIRLIADRDAARARLGQQGERTPCEDTVAPRRVVIRSEGGRRRLRETQRGPKTKQGARRSTGAWREPKGLIVYGVHEAGTRDASGVPVRDATLTGPDAVCAFLGTSVQRLEIPPAAHVLVVADGAAWRGKRVPLLVPAVG